MLEVSFEALKSLVDWNNVISAGIILIAGFITVKIILAIMSRTLAREKNTVVMTFMFEVIKALLYVVIILSALEKLGLGSKLVTMGVSVVAGFLLGQGLQDALSNMLAGIALASIRPFNVGDFVQIGEIQGTVMSLGVFGVELLTPGNQYVLVPNKSVWNSSVINYSRMGARRVEVEVAISYKENVRETVKLLEGALNYAQYVLKNPKPRVLIDRLGDSAVVLKILAWARPEHFLDAKSEVLLLAKETLDTMGIEIPYPQLDVHIKTPETRRRWP